MIPNTFSDFWPSSNALSSVSPQLWNHLWQSTLFAVAVGLLASTLRRYPARIRYWLWMAASIKFLIPFSLLIAAGAHFARPIAPAPSVTTAYVAIDEVSEPFTVAPDLTPSISVTPQPVRIHHLSLPVTLAALWLCGFTVVLAVWLIQWRRVVVSVRRSKQLLDGRVADTLRRIEQLARVAKPIPLLSSPGTMEPGIFGILRPVLLWPEAISAHLDDVHLEAVLAHEACHVRRRDNLTSLVHMLVEALFWFHPLVWWMESQLVKERERACDETVLLLCNRPQAYAEGILKVCEFCVESPLKCVSGITGADLKKRIVRIMTEGLGYKLSFGRKLLLAGIAVLALAVPVMLGQAQAAQRLMLEAIKAAPKPLQAAADAMMSVEEAPSTEEIAQVALPQGLPQLQFDLVSGPRFEAAHVDRNKRVPIPMQDGPTREGDRYVIYAHSMESLVSIAYDVPETQVIGGPPWLEFDRYDIEAKTPETTSDADIKVMLRALLEERFHLTVQNGTYPQPARILSLEKGGSKLKPSSGKEEAGCKRPEHPAPSGTPTTLDCHNQTIKDIADMLADEAGWRDKRPVIDRTGLKGSYDFKLSWVPTIVGADVVPFTEALSSELGLKVENGTAPWTGLLVERADEEPAPDPPDTAKIMPRPLPQFDVSVIKPFDSSSQGRGMMGNGPQDPHEFKWNGITLRYLVGMAWDLNPTIAVVNAPEWLDKDRWYVDSKVLGDQPVANGNNPSPINPDQIELMVRALLQERFHLQAHMEEREGDAYDLVAVNPKLTPVDPNLPLYDRGRRETCAGAPPPGAVDPRTKNPALDTVQYCTAVSMAHLAGQMQLMGAPVRDKTGLTGRYNYILSFTRAARALVNGNGPPSGDANGPPSASDPNGMPISRQDAIQSELGLKLVKVRAQVPVLVIDHIDETPTPN